jgi:hypothetical protein
VTKRQFIDLVRQYKTARINRNKSFADCVNNVHVMYLEGVRESGAGDAEYEKEAEWANGMVKREYGAFDHEWFASTIT